MMFQSEVQFSEQWAQLYINNFKRSFILQDGRENKNDITRNKYLQREKQRITLIVTLQLIRILLFANGDGLSV